MSLTPSAKIRYVIGSVLIIACIVFLVRFYLFPVVYVFSGNFLANRFALQSQLAGDSYQVGITRMFIVAMIFSAVVIPVITVVRWLFDKTRPVARWVFIAFSVAALIFPFCCLIIALHMLLQYVWAMGITSRRVFAITTVQTALCILILFWMWAIQIINLNGICHTALSFLLKICRPVFCFVCGAITRLPQFVKRARYTIGWLGTTLLMLPILFWVWLAAQDPLISVFNGYVPRFILSGNMFTTQFDIIHAGFVLDQPTIGKWLFWFTVMTASSLPYAALVRWLSNRAQKGAYIAYLACIVILSIFLLCILSWPLCWLIQYVSSMGFTERRIDGLLFTAGGILVVIGFLTWSCIKPITAPREQMS